MIYGFNRVANLLRTYGNLITQVYHTVPFLGYAVNLYVRHYYVTLYGQHIKLFLFIFHAQSDCIRLLYIIIYISFVVVSCCKLLINSFNFILSFYHLALSTLVKLS